jgi:transposase-like protein
LAVELSDHLGSERGNPTGRVSPDSRNGTTPKTVLSEVGPVRLDVPRDRASTVEPRLAPATRLHGAIGHVPPVEYEAAHYAALAGRVAP